MKTFLIAGKGQGSVSYNVIRKDERERGRKTEKITEMEYGEILSSV